METFQLYFELIGAVAFAISGAALGIRKGMDLFGVAMVGMTTAVGGGILRDVMLGQTPPAARRGGGWWRWTGRPDAKPPSGVRWGPARSFMRRICCGRRRFCPRCAYGRARLWR